MPGDDGLRAERSKHLLQHVDRAGNRSLRQERRAAVEQEVAAVEHLALREPDNRVVGGVSRRADVAYVCAQVVDP